MGGTDYDITDSRIGDSASPIGWEAACNLDVTNWTKSNHIVVAIFIQSSAHTPDSENFKVQWEKTTDDPGVWIDLGAAGECKYGTSDELNDGDAVGATAGCQTTEDSEELEGNLTTKTFALSQNAYGEIQVAISLADALDGKQYSFRLYSNSASAAVDTPAAAQITTGAVAVTYERTVLLDILLQTAGVERSVLLDVALQKAGIERSVDLDTVLKALGVERTVDIDVALKKLGIEKTVLIDILLKLRAERTVLLDVALQASGIERTVDLDVALQKLGIEKSVDLDVALQKAGITRTVDLDVALQKTGITKSVLLDVILQTAGVSTYQRTVLLDAILKALGVTRTVNLDVALQKQGLTRTVLLDVVLSDAPAEVAIRLPIEGQIRRRRRRKPRPKPELGSFTREIAVTIYEELLEAWPFLIRIWEINNWSAGLLQLVYNLDSLELEAFDQTIYEVEKLTAEFIPYQAQPLLEDVEELSRALTATGTDKTELEGLVSKLQKVVKIYEMRRELTAE